jgi:hypothetical protein
MREMGASGMWGPGRFMGHDVAISRRGSWGGCRLADGPHQQAMLAEGRARLRDALARVGAGLTGGPHARWRRWEHPSCARGWQAQASRWGGPHRSPTARPRRGEERLGRTGGEKKLADRVPNRPKTREERGGMARWAAPRAKKSSREMEGGFWGFSYFLFSSNLLLYEYFTETKQTHKNRCVIQHDAATKENPLLGFINT